MVKGARLVTIKDGPHAVTWTHAEELNAALLDLLGAGTAKPAGKSAAKKAAAGR